MFSVDSELKFPCLIKERAIFHQEGLGPLFGNNCLGIMHMREPNKDGSHYYCSFNGNGLNAEIYNVSDDGNGNSVLTGEGGKGAKFTCVELEVF